MANYIEVKSIVVKHKLSRKLSPKEKEDIEKGELNIFDLGIIESNEETFSKVEEARYQDEPNGHHFILYNNEHAS